MVKKNRVTLQTIADKLGLSKYAVSLAYRNHPRISEKTRKKVFALGASLNYHPSHLGKALAQGKSFKIAVLISDSEQLGAMRQALQCQAMLWDRGYAAVILAGNSVEFQRKILHQLQAHHYDGLISFSWLGFENEELQQEIRNCEAAGIPIVSGTSYRIGRYPQVTIDERHFSGLISGYMLENGVQDFHFVGSGVLTERIGYLREAFLRKNVRFQLLDTFAYFDGKINAERLKADFGLKLDGIGEKYRKVKTGIYCETLYSSIILHDYMLKNRLKTGKNGLEIIGVNDQYDGEFSLIRMNNIAVDDGEYVRLIVESLMGLMDAPTQWMDRTILIPSELKKYS